MATISTCLIVKNEIKNIEKCLRSLQSFSDEIIVYDTGSEDGTQELCKTLDKVKVIQGKWVNDFAWARNESFSRAKCDYILWVDADDVINEKSQQWLIDFKNHDLEKYAKVSLIYYYAATEESLGDFFFYRGRIFKRLCKPVWHGRIHEYVINERVNDENLILDYEVPISECYIIHHKHESDPNRNYNIYKDMESKGQIDTGRDWFYFGNECFFTNHIDEAFINLKKAIECEDIWYIDKLNALVRLGSLYRDVKNDNYKALEYLLRAAACTAHPRADVCCELSLIYSRLKEFDIARWWAQLAINNIPNGIDGTFLSENYYTWVPYIDLCIIEWDANNKTMSKFYNEKVLEIDPTNPSALANQKLFE